MSSLLLNLEKVYGSDARKIVSDLEEYSQAGNLAQSESNPAEKDWHKSIELYCVYPDGVLYDAAKTPLQNLKTHLKTVKRLNCNAVHILPFLESPMIDKGFDISDYMKVRENLGTLKDLKDLVKEAKRLELKLFMDLVFNHVSNEHTWYKKAVEGDEQYRNYFIHTKEKPKFIKKFYKDSAIWADYEIDGKVKSVNVAFPEYAGPIPHWEQAKDGYWYYHTYYPEQIDLNWSNPALFVELAKVVLFWTQIGFNFRFDAIPFIGKGAYKDVNGNNENAHAITAAFKCIADWLNPETAILVETYETLDSVIAYFGRPDILSAHLSYNFHLCTAIWVSLVMQDTEFMWKKLDQMEDIPAHARWLNFLRNHDELSLAYLPDDLLKKINSTLLPNGADFREGCGVSGRTFSLLEQDSKRFLMAYFLLASMPGGVMIPYGDEIGTENIPLKTLSKEQQKDTRNINRSTLKKETYQDAAKKSMFKKFAAILEYRKILRNYLNDWPQEVKISKHIFAARYEGEKENLLIYINLSGKPQEIKLDESCAFKLAAQVNRVKVQPHKINLGAYGGVWLSCSKTQDK